MSERRTSYDIRFEIEEAICRDLVTYGEPAVVAISRTGLEARHFGDSEFRVIYTAATNGGRYPEIVLGLLADITDVDAPPIVNWTPLAQKAQQLRAFTPEPVVEQAAPAE